MSEEYRENANDIVLLEDDDGNVIKFQMLGLVMVSEIPYAVLLPDDEDDAEMGVVIVAVRDIGQETEHYDAVTDETLCERVFAQFRSDFKDQYDFE